MSGVPNRLFTAAAHPSARTVSRRGRRTLPGLIGAGLVLAAPFALAACGTPPERVTEESSAPQGQESAASDDSSAEPGEGDCAYPASGEPAKKVDPPSTTDVEKSGEVVFTIATNEGDVSVTMDRSKAPCTVNSFESLASQGYFDDTSCHRLVDSGIFVLQCGDPTGTGSGGPGYTFADEVTSDATYGPGTVAMANAGPDTNGSQFFLVYDESPLDPDYTVFGQMDETSIGVVARIATEGQDGSFGEAGGGKPNNPAEINSVKPNG